MLLKIGGTSRPEEGAHQAADLPITRHGGIGRIRLHRDVLQPNPPTWFRRRAVAGRVREALRAKRRLSVYGNLVGPRVSATAIFEPLDDRRIRASA